MWFALPVEIKREILLDEDLTIDDIQNMRLVAKNIYPDIGEIIMTKKYRKLQRMFTDFPWRDYEAGTYRSHIFYKSNPTPINPRFQDYYGARLFDKFSLTID